MAKPAALESVQVVMQWLGGECPERPQADELNLIQAQLPDLLKDLLQQLASESDADPR